MAATPERRERSGGERVRGKEGMASRRATENGGLPEPWLASPGEGSPFWGWSGDEETLPLLGPEIDDGEEPVTEKVLSGPWILDETNPFVSNVWTPLRSKFRPQENLETVPREVPVNVELLINEGKVEPLNKSRALLSVTDPYNTCLLYTSPSPRD